ncbi:hypothetical protein [Flavobacterium sp. RSP49]|uniref:hypothetical protein n=1 Tax=Flavobacterium sp. RSP49 TaxID=2497487 RepID=UPI001F2A8363|nr:hypothetical protein [Flavobacterium sp. RSP49]
MITHTAFKGKFSKKKNIYLHIGFPKTNEYCLHGHNKFEKEPGYFHGAMYVNYCLAVAQSIATFGLAQFFFAESFD